ncbi:MAG: NAD(P)-dependent oxidoreductase [Candidatus Pelagibacter sp. TMED165]|nr:MAG: NAD(P)-dependent oxidoreductase [Candidatus Pelagibacter sp. TMED165]
MLSNKTKILIPGGTGFIGYHLIFYLVKKGWIVHSLSKFKPKKTRRVKGAKYIYCDVRDKKKLRSKLDKYYDYIVNLSGYVDHSNNQSITRIHFNGCKNLIFNYLNNKPKKFIQIGSSIEYGKQRSPQRENKKNSQETYSTYGNAKLLSTKFLLEQKKKYNFPITILRLYLVYGPKQDLNRLIPITIMNALKKVKFNCSEGKQLRDFVYIDDLINAIVKTFKNEKSNGEIINVGSGNPISVKKLIIKICKLANGGNPQFGKVSLRKDEIFKLYPSLKKVKKILNWQAKVNLDKGLKKTIKYYKI